VADEREKGALVGRRRLLKGLAGGAGAALSWPAFATEHPIHKHLENDAALDAARAAGETPGAPPEFFDPHELETFASLAERIVPGSGAAQVAPFVDRLVGVDTPENRKELLQSIGAFDGAAIARHGHPWKALSQEQQVAILTEAAAMAPSRPSGGRWSSQPSNAPTADPAVRRTLRDSFESIKGWVVGAYYSSETGLREMGYTGNVFFESYPGCPHPDGHAE
jgi:Gluconate 2-dehydrogenase subunit 3